ncbi:hypothetical protein BJY52DRAFT_1296805 [Lactarius psammicola]|nr:hypothetical protein BJY52DRAFT_1296805 [Lactarius psammicola]
MGRSLATNDVSYDKALAHPLHGEYRINTLSLCASTLARSDHSQLSPVLLACDLCSTIGRRDKEGGEDDHDLWLGNKRCALWKATCMCAALDIYLSSVERALYAMCVLSVQTSGVLKSAYRRWENALMTVSQLGIILDCTDALLDVFASGLRDEAYDRESAEVPVGVHDPIILNGYPLPDSSL